MGQVEWRARPDKQKITFIGQNHLQRTKERQVRNRWDQGWEQGSLNKRKHTIRMKGSEIRNALGVGEIKQ